MTVAQTAALLQAAERIAAALERIANQGDTHPQKGTTMPTLIRVYQDNSGEWRWQAKAKNGRILGDSGEGYHNRGDCLTTAHRLFPEAVIDVTTDDTPDSEGKP